MDFFVLLISVVVLITFFWMGINISTLVKLIRQQNQQTKQLLDLLKKPDQSVNQDQFAKYKIPGV